MNLNQITVQSTDVEQTLQFYLSLGLELIVDATPSYVRLVCPAGNSTFSISHANHPVKSNTTIYFEVDDVDLMYRKMISKGISFITEPIDQRWLWRESELIDPDGNRLKIYSAGINRRSPPWRVKSEKWYERIADATVNIMK